MVRIEQSSPVLAGMQRWLMPSVLVGTMSPYQYYSPLESQSAVFKDLIALCDMASAAPFGSKGSEPSRQPKWLNFCSIYRAWNS